MLRATAEVGLWDVSSTVQPSRRRPPALPLSLLLRRAAMQPSPGQLLLQLAVQLPPPARLAGPLGVFAALTLSLQPCKQVYVMLMKDITSNQPYNQEIPALLHVEGLKACVDTSIFCYVCRKLWTSNNLYNLKLDL